MPVVVGVFLIGGSYLFIEAIATVALFASLLAIAVAVVMAILFLVMLGDIIWSIFKNPLVAPIVWLGYFVLAGIMVCTPSVILYFVWGGHTSVSSNHLHWWQLLITFVMFFVWLGLTVWAAMLYMSARDLARESTFVDFRSSPSPVGDGPRPLSNREFQRFRARVNAGDPTGGLTGRITLTAEQEYELLCDEFERDDGHPLSEQERRQVWEEVRAHPTGTFELELRGYNPQAEFPPALT